MFTGRRALHDYTATVTRLDASPRTPVTFRRFKGSASSNRVPQIAAPQLLQ